MGKSLPQCLFKKTLLFAALLFGIVTQGAYSQSAGDIAIIGFNGDANDDFAAVTFTDISDGDEIHFSSEEWDGSGFEGTGGHFTWIAPAGGISAGTVLVFNEVGGTPTVNFGSIIDDSNISLSVSGDVIYAYTGTSQSDPDTFLGATATSSDLYSQPDGTEGTLVGTGLTQGTTAILLPDNIDVAEYAGNRSGNTKNVYQTELNDNNNWETANGNGDQSGEILPFDDTNFVLVDPPTVAFTASSLSADENGTSIDLTVELVEDDATAINVDVVFVDDASTASTSDINGFSSENVNFSDSDGSGTTKNVTVTLDNDSEFESDEKAVFQLQNISTGTIITPEELTLTIEDNDAPDIVINEIHADPGATEGDADGNGEIDGNDDEFVEIVNNQNTDIDISGWTVSEEDGLRHTFPDGTVIPAGGALVLFADDEVSPVGSFGGAVVQSSNESPTLHLNNTGDTVELADPDGNPITEITYGSEGGDDQSITRDSDITGSFVKHSEASNSDGFFSPGTYVDGTTPFGSKHAIAFRGTEGWRMVSSPVENASFNDFFGDLWMQGLTGSNDDGGDADATILSWNESDSEEEGGTFEIPGTGNMSDPIEPGKGYIVYVFEDDDNNAPGIQGGFPKIINTDKDENSNTVDVTVSATDADDEGDISENEGWNLLGNPFASDLSVDALIDALEGIDPVVDANIYVWDHDKGTGNGGYVALGDGERIAPFQAFFVRFTNVVDETFSFNKSNLEANTGTEFYKNKMKDVLAFDLELHGEQYYDTYSLEFSEDGTTDLDRYDAYKLFSLNPNSINIFSTHSNNRLQKNALPRELESAVEIPLSFDANGRTSLTFRWDKEFENFPSEWDLMLIDNETNREIDLRRDEEYSFNISGDKEKEMAASTSDKKGLLYKAKDNQDSRFTLSVQPKEQQEQQNDLPNTVKLNPNYPNPFNPSTTIPYELTENAEVKLTVWNMIGQKVATLVDGLVEAGTHEETWNASSMPSGMYIARFEVGGKVFTRKMTLIK